MYLIDRGKIIKIPPDFFSNCSERTTFYKPIIHWYDRVLKFITDSNSVTSFIALAILAYFFFRSFETPYIIRYGCQKILCQELEYLNCIHNSTPKEEIFKLQRLVYKIDHILWKLRLKDKDKSIGLKSWIKSGDVPTTELLQEIDKLAENLFDENQKSKFRILKATWKPIIGLTIDRDIIIVYIHSVMTLYGITLREWLLDDDFLILLKLVEQRSATNRKEFGEKETNQLIDLLITLIPSDNGEKFKTSTDELFIEEYEITNSRKYDLVELFCYNRVIGGSKNEQTI